MAPAPMADIPSGPPRPSQNLRNPLPLSATQEQEVRKLYYARVRARCADEIKGEYELLRGCVQIRSVDIYECPATPAKSF